MDIQYWCCMQLRFTFSVRHYLEWKNSFSSDLNQFVQFVSSNGIEAEREGVLVSNLIAAQNNYTNNADVVFSATNGKTKLVL